ncbi:MAG TPA: hypothetical protein GX515_06555 [Firmicutes bacterium]|nr:hypothetical protein [Bacillota bacterium]
MDEVTALRQTIGGVAVTPFIFSIAPVGFFVALVPRGSGNISVFRVSEPQYVFLRRVGVPEVVVFM